MKEHLLVVDIGTQSLRASIIDKDGNTIVFSQKKYETPYFSVKEGFAEQDADYFFCSHSISSRAYSDKDDAIDLLYADGTIRNIADASDMWNLTALTRQVHHDYLYYYKI